MSEVSKFCVNSLSIVYHCAVHNLPTSKDPRREYSRNDLNFQVGLLTGKQSLRQGFFGFDGSIFPWDGWMEIRWMIANVVIYHTVVL